MIIRIKYEGDSATYTPLLTFPGTTNSPAGDSSLTLQFRNSRRRCLSPSHWLLLEMDDDEEHDFDDCVDPKRVELVLVGESSPDVKRDRAPFCLCYSLLICGLSLGSPRPSARRPVGQ